MPIVAAFTVSNNAITPSAFTLTDTSTGSDASIANRLIFLYQSDNSIFSGAPIQFPLSAGNSISPNLLTEDFAFNCVVQWVDSSGTVLYSASQIGVFTGFLEWFYYSLTQYIAAQSNVLNDTGYLSQWSFLRNFIDSANQAISISASIYNAQLMILLGQAIQTNKNLIF